jgi:hypothetical protein
MLGHVELSTTQIYKQVSIRRLKTVHSLTHPSAKIDRSRASTTASVGGDSGGRGTPSLAAEDKPLLDPGALEARDAVVELMASLAPENDEDEGG